MSRSRRAAAVTVIAALASARAAHAYDFSVHTRIIAQAYDLRSIHLYGGDTWLGRRRYTQTLALDLYDLGDLAAKRRKEHRHFGPTVTFTSYLRIDHDFGDWTQGTIMSGARPIDAVDLVPELGASNLSLDLLYAYLDVRGLADGAIDLRIGRQLRVDALDWFAMDGVTARVVTPVHVAVEAFGGLRVRDASPLGTSQVELDGTTGADCREYIEGYNGAGLGHGSWQLIDRSRQLYDSPRADDTGYCPQRDQLMPTWGAAIETDDLHGVYARVVYRRSESPTVGIIGDPGGLKYGTDAGYYPNEWGQAPAWGVNEERLAATVRANYDWNGGRDQVSPWVAARYSLLQAEIDEAEAGVRVRLGEHAVEPQVGHYIPTFDGDSIFNVFAIDPSDEARVAWSWAPRSGRLRTSASVWYRQFHHDDEGHTKIVNGKPIVPATSDDAFGFTAAADLHIDDDWIARADAFSDNGYGGLRSGGAAALRWRENPRLTTMARASVVYIATDSTVPNLRALTTAGQLAASWQLADGVAVHGLVEDAYDVYLRADVRVLGVLDLAFAPEM